MENHQNNVVSESSGHPSELLDAAMVLDMMKSYQRDMRKTSTAVHQMHLYIKRLERDGTRRPQMNSVKYRLDEDDDKKLINEMGVEGILKKFRKAGRPFKDVVAVDLGHRNTAHIFFMTRSNEAEMALRNKAARISPILGLSPFCSMVPIQYILEVRNMSRYKLEHAGLVEHFARPQRFTSLWSTENDVSIRNARQRRGRLLLILSDEKEALRLVDNGVFLHGRWSPVIPRDIQSFTKHCHNCYGINHLKNECTSPHPRCGWCAKNHHTDNCKDIGDLPKAKCVNCKDGDHPSWSPKCWDPKVVSMRADCRDIARAGPSWAPKAPQFLSSESESKNKGSKEKGDQNKDHSDDDEPGTHASEENGAAGKRLAGETSAEEPAVPLKRRSQRIQKKQPRGSPAIIDVSETDHDFDFEDDEPIAPCIVIPGNNDPQD